MNALTATLCLICLVGCSRTPPLEQLVEADTPINFTQWRSKHRDTLTPQAWALFDEAMKEIKLKIMRDGKASGSEAVDTALCAKINGLKLGDAMHLGLQIRLERLKSAQTILAESLSFNSRLKPRPGAEEKAKLLAEKIREQTDQLAKLQATVAEAEADLRQSALKKQGGGTSPPP